MDENDDTLADLRKLDAVVHALGIEDTFDDPAEAIAKLQAENQRFRDAMRQAADIIDRNLHHQREKVQDASVLLKAAMSGNQ